MNLLNNACPILWAILFKKQTNVENKRQPHTLVWIDVRRFSRAFKEF